MSSCRQSVAGLPVEGALKPSSLHFVLDCKHTHRFATVIQVCNIVSYQSDSEKSDPTVSLNYYYIPLLIPGLRLHRCAHAHSIMLQCLQHYCLTRTSIPVSVNQHIKSLDSFNDVLIRAPSHFRQSQRPGFTYKSGTYISLSYKNKLMSIILYSHLTDCIT